MAGQTNYTVIYGETYNIVSINKQKYLNDFDRKQALYINGDSLAFYSFSEQKPDKKDSTVGGEKDHHSLFLFPKLKRVITENFWVRPYNLQEMALAGYDWKFHEDTMIIAGFKCNVAVTDGITAWFTLDIPASFGPVDFGGLPGLILMIEDYRNKRLYKVISVVPSAPRIILPDIRLTACKNCESKLKEIHNYFTD